MDFGQRRSPVRAPVVLTRGGRRALRKRDAGPAGPLSGPIHELLRGI